MRVTSIIVAFLAACLFFHGPSEAAKRGLQLKRTGEVEVTDNHGIFYREYWAEPEEQVNSSAGRFLRVNDPEIALHPNFGRRGEARTNGLLLIPLDEDLFRLKRAELYLELWGGHPGTANKRFYLNGRGPCHLPEVGSEAGHCTYSYPAMPLEVSHLVRHVNAFQFAGDRGHGFWGHYIVDNACLRAYLEADHPALEEAGLAEFTASVAKFGPVGDRPDVRLEYPDRYRDEIESVEFFARYTDFDDDGDGEGDDWHGFTFHREPVNHVGAASEPPFAVEWDTRMISSQDGPMAVRAVVRLRDGFHYRTPVLDGLTFPADRPAVRLFAPAQMPKPFWSRASNGKTAIVELPDDLSGVESAELMVKVWDGGQGSVEEPFTINGHPYDVLSGRALHDVVFTRQPVELVHLRPGPNELRVLSDTEHHGIEVLLPGPCLRLRWADGGR